MRGTSVRVEIGVAWRLGTLTDAMCCLIVQIGRYVVVGCLAAGLEAFSVQNDNLTLPLYMWAMLVFGDVVE